MDLITELEAFLPSLIKLPRDLHKNPELSGTEVNTAKRILAFFAQFRPDEVISKIGGQGVIGLEDDYLVTSSGLERLTLTDQTIMTIE